jgi:hypothetical protein
VVFLAILGAFLVWRRKRNKARASPADVAVAPEDNPAGDHSNIFEKDSKPAPLTTTKITVIKYPPGLPDEPAKPNPTYKRPVSPIDYPHTPLSQAYVEVAGPVPAEIDASNHQITSGHAHTTPHAGFVEADSMIAMSHNITPPLSELEQPSLIYHELPSTTLLQSLPSGLASSSPAAYPAHTPAPPSDNPVGETEAEDPELARMKTDLEALRIEKEQVRRLQSIEAREKELRRRIVERELGVRRESSGPS